MSGIAKAIKKVFSSSLFKVIVVAAAIWFTAGTATAYFAAPQAGLGAAMSTSASTMWTQTATFFGAGQTSSSSLIADAGTVATPLTETGVGAAVPLGEAASLAPEAVVDAAVTAGGTATVPGAITPIVGEKVAETGMMAWLKANPMATMMLGQGVVGAYGGYLEDKQAQAELDERNNRGLMGFDSTGAYKGVVQSQTPENTLTEPEARFIPGQQVAQQEVNAQGVPVPREDLTKLNQQGQIRRG